MITRLGLYGGPTPDYWSREQALTRLGLYGGPWPPYNQFVKVVDDGLGAKPGPDADTQVKGGKKKKYIFLPKTEGELEVGSDKLLPDVLSDVSKETKEAVLTGKVEVEVDGEAVTVEVPSAPNPPTLELSKSMPDLKAITNDIDREIASLIRAQETVLYNQRMVAFREELLRFDEEFILLLLLLLE
jgi:hypothetical protein